MRRLIDHLILLGLLILIAFLVHQPTQFADASAKPANHVTRSRPLTLDRSTKFDLLFSEPEWARP